MLKQDLIDAAEASGLSQGAIGYIFTEFLLFLIAPAIFSELPSSHFPSRADRINIKGNRILRRTGTLAGAA